MIENESESTSVDRIDSLNERQRTEVIQDLKRLTAAGRPIPAGLRAMASEAADRRVSRSLLQIADELEGGEAISEILDSRIHGLSWRTKGIVQAAIASGRIAEVFAEFTRFERIGNSLRRQVWFRLAYPMLLLSGFLLLFSFLSSIVLVDFKALAIDFGLELPVTTIGLIALSDAVQSDGWAIPLAIILNVVLVWIAGRGMARGPRRRVYNTLPVIGALWRTAAMAEFSRLLALLIDCKLPMPEALVLAGEGVHDQDLEIATVQAAEIVREGKSLTSAIAEQKLYPAGFANLLSWAEQHGSIPDALRMASETLVARARSQAVALGIVLSVLVNCLVVFGIQLTIAGIYLPLIKLLSWLSG